MTRTLKLIILYALSFLLMMGSRTITVAQDTYLPRNSDEIRYIERAESKSWNLIPQPTAVNPISRKLAAQILEEYKEMSQLQMGYPMSPTEEYQIDNLLQKNIEWTQPNMEGEYGKKSKRPLLKYFYHTPANFYQYESEQLFLVFNPVIYTQVGYEKGMSKYPSILSRGAEMRARLWDKIGVYTILSEHQERMPSYSKDVATGWGRAFPGHDYHTKSHEQLYDVLMARGYVDFSIYRDIVKVTAGYDKHFLGDGIRSLWLADQGAPYSFARINYNMGKIQYQNLFMELAHDYNGSLDRRIPAKYASMHYLTAQLGSKWQVGLFESTVYNTSDLFKVQMLQPIIGLNTAMQNTTNHKSAIGLNFKGIIVPGITIYGQSYFNSIDINTIRSGGWKNQYALQGGVKYYDVFTIPRLDMQVEYNHVRPFTYAGLNSIQTNYTHWNQPLAHPLESGFYEIIGQLHYTPIKKVQMDAKVIYAQKSKPLPIENNGSSIFAPLDTRSGDVGFYIRNDAKNKHLFANVNVAYEWRPNIYFDAGINYHGSRFNLTATPNNVVNLYAGMRMNMLRRVYDWF